MRGTSPSGLVPLVWLPPNEKHVFTMFL